jgi:membrane protein
LKRANFISLLKETYTDWTEDRGPRFGAALAYYAIFSIPPLMMIALAAIARVYSGNIIDRLQNQLAVLIGDETAKTLLTGVQMNGPKGGLTAGIIGIAILLSGASGVFGELQDALNTIWNVKPKGEGLKGLIKGRFTSYTMVLGTAFLLLVSLIISSIVAALSAGFAGYLPGGAAVAHLLENATSFVVITVLFAMIFKFLPDVKIRWRDVWVGAAVTALLFTLGKLAIGMYIGKAGIGSAYGAAGSIVVLITWVYYSAQILFFGAEFTQVWTHRRGAGAEPAENAEPLKAEDRLAQGLSPKQKPAPAAQFRPNPRPERIAAPHLWNYALVSVLWLGTALLMRRKESTPSKAKAA